jgi:hypothetical protein
MALTLKDPDMADSESGTGRSVTVYLKHPAGITAQLHRETVVDVPIRGGGIDKVREFRREGGTFTFNGSASHFGVQRKDAAGEFVMVIGGYAVTRNVPKDFWDKWIAQNSALDIVVNKLIYAHEKDVEGAAWAKDHASLKHGMEPLVPTLTDGGGKVIQTDPRAPRSPARDVAVAA